MRLLLLLLPTTFQKCQVQKLACWQNYWLMAERQAAWGRGELELRPGGHDTPPSTRDLFEFVWTIDRDYMPKWRALFDACAEDTTVLRITDVAELAELRLD